MVDETQKKYYDSRIFCAFWAILGTILLALLANEVSRVLLWILYHLFACPCCCDSILTSSDNLQLSNTTIAHIKKNGVIDLRDFLQTQFANDEDFLDKLDQGYELFDKYDVKGNDKIDMQELKVVYKEQHRERISTGASNQSGLANHGGDLNQKYQTSVPM